MRVTRAQFKNSLGGLHYFDYPAAVAVNANGRLAVAAFNSSAVSLLGLVDQKTGLVSDNWVGIGTATPGPHWTWLAT